MAAKIRLFQDCQSQEIEMQPDGETVKVSTVVLEGENRRKLSDFFRDAIVQESEDMLNKLGSSPSSDFIAKSRDVIYRVSTF